MGTWDETTFNWYNGIGRVPWIDGDAAFFGGTASINSLVKAVQLTPGSMIFVRLDFFGEKFARSWSVRR